MSKTIENYKYEDIVSYLLSLIPKDEISRLQGTIIEFCSEFAGFVDTYYHLSQIIPKNFTVIDFGAGWNAQSYFFTEHKKYIAVTPPTDIIEDSGMFCAPNCEIYRMTTGEFLRNNNVATDNVFAICNYVPNWYGEDSMKLVRENFQNVYTFYP